MVENNEARPDVRVRTATLEDVEIIAEFQLKMAMETENITLDRPTVKIAVERVLKSTNMGAYYMAYDENDADKKSIAVTGVTYEMNFSVGGFIHMI